MKLTTLVPSLIAVSFISVATAAPLETFEQRISYIVGQNVAKQMSGLDVPLNEDAFQLALKEAMGTDSKQFSLSEEAKRTTIAEARKRSADIRTKQMAVAGEKNIKEGKEYMEANAKKEGVVTTASGLQYKEITAGKGEKPKTTDKVKVHYKGSLIDGTVFDSSYKRGKPATFPVTGVIKGWIEALQLMNVGDKFQLAIPGDLAYGPRGKGGNIGPSQTLLFDVELIEIVK